MNRSALPLVALALTASQQLVSRPPASNDVFDLPDARVPRVGAQHMPRCGIHDLLVSRGVIAKIGCSRPTRLRFS
jgi:hypothetical protein